MKIVRKPIDEKEFVKTWARIHRTGGGIQDVAMEIGCSYAGAKNKAENLVEKGIPLPELKKGRGSKQIDVASLKNILEEELAR
jgi:hypothetical protein